MITKQQIKYRHLSWDDIDKYCLAIYAQMCHNKYRPEVIIGLLRGGIVPARIFSDFFNIFIDFFALDVKLYTGINKRNEEPIIKTFFGDVKGRSILLIDDIYDSGKTMNAVLKYLEGENITTATLLWKETAENKPNYYAEIAKKDEWIVFPFERYEFWREVSQIDGH